MGPQREIPFWTFWLVAVILLVLWLTNLAFGLMNRPSSVGEWGDIFGASNALFSGAAFCGLFYAILLQRSEISIAKEDLRTTQKILDEQNSALRGREVEEMRRGNRQVFFNLVETFQQSRDSLNVITVSGPSIDSGAATIKYLEAFFLASQYYDNSITNIAALERNLDFKFRNFGYRLLELFNIVILMVDLFDGQDMGARDFYMHTCRTLIGRDLAPFLIRIAATNKYGSELRKRVEMYGLLHENIDLSSVPEFILDAFEEEAFEYFTDFDK